MRLASKYQHVITSDETNYARVGEGFVDLASKSCRPCEGGELPLPDKQVQALLLKLDGWLRVENSIQKQFQFQDFSQSIAFVNLVAAIAESEDHHPDIAVRWNSVTLSLTTHAIGGLSENDFILAAKIEQIQTQHAGVGNS